MLRLLTYIWEGVEFGGCHWQEKDRQGIHEGLSEMTGCIAFTVLLWQCSQMI